MTTVLDGVMLLWFLLTAASLLFVAIDIRSTPEAPVLKWGFVILTAFAGPVGAFFYVLGCREPLPGTHEQYVSATWRQVLGSTMHCAAGDGVGILAGAVLGSLLAAGTASGIALEYALGFLFGWGFFQAYAMRDMAGGDYGKSLRMTFIPELVSMNCLMSGMVIVSRFWMPIVPGAESASSPAFWFIMSMALLFGFLCAYPMNWWLVTRHLKHGMMTVATTAGSPNNNRGHGEHALHETPSGHAQHKAHGAHGKHETHGAHEKHGGHGSADHGNHAQPMAHGEETPEHETPPGGQVLAMVALSAGILAVCIGIVLRWAPSS